MTKEQIKQHKNTMIWFIDNPSKGLWFKQDGSDWILTKSPTFKCYEGLAYVPNDEYASLRMAEADGKTIQFKAFGEWKDSFNFNWSQPLEYYRIKPDCPTLKVDDKVLVWPDLVYIEFIALILFMVFLIVWSILVAAPLEEPANPAATPNPSKAPWYFLGLQEMLVYFDPWMAGVVLPGVVVVGLISIPYIDTNPKGNGYYTIKERPIAMWGFLFGWLALWLYLIMVGTFLRGPNWTFYGPFEFWDHHKVVASYNINLSEFFWIKGLNSPMPQNMFVREIVGIVLALGYIFVLPPLTAMTSFGKEMISKVGQVRYYIFIALLLLMVSLPIKMILRWLFSLKYIVALPEIELSL